MLVSKRSGKWGFLKVEKVKKELAKNKMICPYS